jgi:hypothetical protein
MLTVQEYARPLLQKRRLSGLRRTLRRDLESPSGVVIGNSALADIGLRSSPFDSLQQELGALHA